MSKFWGWEIECDPGNVIQRSSFGLLADLSSKRGRMRVADVMSSKACGTHMHVHPVPGCEWAAFCVDCWDRAGPPRVGDDLGDSA